MRPSVRTVSVLEIEASTRVGVHAKRWDVHIRSQEGIYIQPILVETTGPARALVKSGQARQTRKAGESVINCHRGPVE